MHASPSTIRRRLACSSVTTRTVTAAAVAMVLLAACGDDEPASGADPTRQPSAQAPSEGAANPTTLPKKEITPGATFADATQEMVCAPDYTKEAGKRDVVSGEEVYQAYGLDFTQGSDDRRGHKLDRIIPVSLGGNNSLQNIWPQPVADFETKDRFEQQLRAKVCNGEVPLEQAQKALAEDWIAAMEQFG